MFFSDKGHGILAPFTAGQQMTENKPLVIERSEVTTLQKNQNAQCISKFCHSACVFSSFIHLSWS